MKNLDISNEKEDSYIIIEYSNENFIEDEYIDLFDFMIFSVNNKKINLRFKNLNLEYDYSTKEIILKSEAKNFIYQNKNSFIKFFAKDLYCSDIEKR